MQEIPLQATPNQKVLTTLASQNCEINVYQRMTGLYLDLFIDNVPIVNTRLCVDRVPIVRNTSSGFVGELYFYDKTGTQNPDYIGLGTNFILVYV